LGSIEKTLRLPLFLEPIHCMKGVSQTRKPINEFLAPIPSPA
jgi:hypothetical protein